MKIIYLQYIPSEVVADFSQEILTEDELKLYKKSCNDNYKDFIVTNYDGYVSRDKIRNAFEIYIKDKEKYSSLLPMLCVDEDIRSTIVDIYKKELAYGAIVVSKRVGYIDKDSQLLYTGVGPYFANYSEELGLHYPPMDNEPVKFVLIKKEQKEDN